MKAVGTSRRAFTVLELLVIVVIIGVMIALTIPALVNVDRVGREAVCKSNLKQLGIANQSYAADYRDLIAAFTWKRTGPNNPSLPTQYADLLQAPTDVAAAAAQAVHTLRRRADRDDMPASLIGAWIPHLYYTQLVIQDYLAARLPEQTVACPEDKARLNWQLSPRENFDEGVWLPMQPAPDEQAKRWPYSATYQTVPAAFDNGPAGVRVSAADHCCLNTPGAARFGGRLLGEVAHPSLKVHLMDQEARHDSRQSRLYAVVGAAQPLLFFDGSVKTKRTGGEVYQHLKMNRLMVGNEGWRPNEPSSVEPTIMRYAPEIWEARVSTGALVEEVRGYFRWTREGLDGVDFGAEEVYR